MASSEEAQFEQELFETFRTECEERVESVTSALLSLEKSEATWDTMPDVRAQFFREIHSLKGGARAVNVKDIEQLMMEIESCLSPLKEGSGYELRDEDFQALFEILDTVNDVMMLEPNASERKEKCAKLHEKIQHIHPQKAS